MISKVRVQKLIQDALREDLGSGDVTTSSLIPSTQRAKGIALAKSPGILAGVEVATEVFRTIDPSCSVVRLMTDSSRITSGDRILTVEGLAAPMLAAERVALNFLQRMSGIATQTARFVEAIRGLDVRIIDTRKTTPGLRMLEKYSVRMGGGFNHRFGLYDGILVKDNHLALLQGLGVSLRDAVGQIRGRVPHTMKVEVEATNLDQVREALEAGADAILLDNMDVEEIRDAVKLVSGRALVEASGGITLDNVRKIAEMGVDLISIGAITHSAPSLDISFEIVASA